MVTITALVPSAERENYLARYLSPRVGHVFRVMDETQARAFLPSVAEDRLQALYSLALLTGLRQGELLGLSWADVDLARGKLRVDHSLQRQAGELRLVPPKTARSRRVVSLPTVAVLSLRGRRCTRRRGRAAPGR